MPYAPSYYAGTFLEVSLRPPAALLRFEQRPGDGKQEGDDRLFARHLALLQHQLQQLQVTLTLALALTLTLMLITLFPRAAAAPAAAAAG